MSLLFVLPGPNFPFPVAMVENAFSFDPAYSFALSLVFYVLHRDHISMGVVTSFLAYIVDVKLPQSSGRALSTIVVISLS